MESEITKWVTVLWEGAGSTIAWEIVVFGSLGAVLGGLLVLVFKLVSGLLLGDATGKWAGAWTAVWIVALVVISCSTAVIGGGEGLVRGGEKALRQSEFGAKTLPAIAQQSVYLYAAIYYADPSTLQGGDLMDLSNLGSLGEVRAFAAGKGELDAARLQARLDDLNNGDRLAELARSAHDDLAQLTPVLGEDLPGVKAAADMVLEYAVRPDVDAELGGAMPGPLFDVRSAAGLHGDPAAVTRDELAEHMREQVAIPALLAPLKVLVRPWQVGAAIVAALMLLLLLATRIVVWQTRKGQTARE